MIFDVSHFGMSDAGRVRTENQDRWCAFPQLGLYVVADGLGGHASGGLAADIVIDTLPQLLQEPLSADALPEKRLRDSLIELSHQLWQASSKQVGLDGMGATVVAAWHLDDYISIGHMGDSRAYLIRDRQLTRLSTDHSIVQLLIDEGQIAEVDAGVHPATGRITRYVGMAREVLPDVSTRLLRAHDRLLLCTDGLTSMLDDQRIESLANDQPDVQQACVNLVSAANEAGGDDNICILMVAFCEA